MKTHILLYSLLGIFFTEAAPEPRAAIHAGSYILVYYGEGVDVDPEVVTLVQSDDDRWKLSLEVDEKRVTAEVTIIEAGAYEEKAHTDFVSTVTAQLPSLVRFEGKEKRVVSYDMRTLVLHGSLEFNGSIRGVFARTSGRPPRPYAKNRAWNGKFVMKPLEAQQENGADQPTPESKSEGKEKPKPESKARPQ